MTFMTGPVLAAELAPLEQLPRLRSLTLSASRQSEEAGEHCLSGFPDSLLRLKGLRSLAVSSLGACCTHAGVLGCGVSVGARRLHMVLWATGPAVMVVGFITACEVTAASLAQ